MAVRICREAGIVLIGYLRTSWNRIVTDYDRDTDVIMGGVGYRF